MEIKDLLKKLALCAGSVALLATAGGAISANASSENNIINYNKKAGLLTNSADHTPAANNPSDIHVIDHAGGAGIDFTVPGGHGKYYATANSPLYKQLKNYKESGSDNGNANTYVNGHYNYANEANHNNGGQVSNNEVHNQSNSDAIQSGNKLVQTGENNGAEYAAITGAILAISGVAFAGYDFERKNA